MRNVNIYKIHVKFFWKIWKFRKKYLKIFSRHQHQKCSNVSIFVRLFHHIHPKYQVKDYSSSFFAVWLVWGRTMQTHTPKNFHWCRWGLSGGSSACRPRSGDFAKKVLSIYAGVKTILMNKKLIVNKKK